MAVDDVVCALNGLTYLHWLQVLCICVSKDCLCCLTTYMLIGISEFLQFSAEPTYVASFLQ